MAKLYITVNPIYLIFAQTHHMVCKTQKQFHDDMFLNNTSLGLLEVRLNDAKNVQGPFI